MLQNKKKNRKGRRFRVLCYVVRKKVRKLEWRYNAQINTCETRIVEHLKNKESKKKMLIFVQYFVRNSAQHALNSTKLTRIYIDSPSLELLRSLGVEMFTDLEKCVSGRA